MQHDSKMQWSSQRFSSIQNVPSCVSGICNQHSRHSDARLTDYLRAQVFSWQFEGSIQES